MWSATKSPVMGETERTQFPIFIERGFSRARSRLSTSRAHSASFAGLLFSAIGIAYAGGRPTSFCDSLFTPPEPVPVFLLAFSFS